MNNEFNQAERNKAARGSVSDLSVPEAAVELGVDAFALYALIQDGKVKPNRTSGGSLYFAKSEIEWLLNGVAESGSETEEPC